MRTFPACFFIFCTFLFALLGPLQAAEKIQVKGLSENWAILEIDGKQRSLRAGQTSPEGVKLISSNSREAVLEINGEQRSYALGNTSSVSTAFKKPERASLELFPDSRGHYSITGTINGIPVDFLVDTGASFISMNEITAKRIGLNFKKGKTAYLTTASGYSRGYRISLDSVTVGPIEENRVQAVVHEGKFPPFVLLGNSFLDRMNLLRDGTSLTLSDKN